MKAVLIGGREFSEIKPITTRYPTPLIPILEKPILQIIVEKLVKEGIKDIELISIDRPELIEAFLGDGSRWGCHFHYRLARDYESAGRQIKAIDLTGHDHLLLASAEVFPAFDFTKLHKIKKNSWASICRQDYDKSNKKFEDVWTEWAVLSQGFVQEIEANVTMESLAKRIMQGGGSGEKWMADRVLSVRSFASVLSSSQSILNRSYPDILNECNEIQPDVWAGRNVKIDRSVKICPPVYIGSNCRVGANVILGPAVVMGNDCIVDDNCMIGDSVIFPKSYIGEGLEINNNIVDKNRVISVEFKGAITIDDDFILANMEEKIISRIIEKLSARILALFLIIFLSPLMLLGMLFIKISSKSVLKKREVVKLPFTSGHAQPKTFTLLGFNGTESKSSHGKESIHAHFVNVFLPGLFSILKGELGFVGLRARSREEVASLSEDWRHLYLRSKGGLITEELIYVAKDGTDDDRYAADAYYSVRSGFKHDFKLCMLYLIRFFLP